MQHPQTLLYAGHLGAVLSDLNRHESAISLLQHAEDGLIAVYGPKHPHTRAVCRDLQKAQERRGPPHKRARHNNSDQSTLTMSCRLEQGTLNLQKRGGNDTDADAQASKRPQV